VLLLPMLLTQQAASCYWHQMTTVVGLLDVGGSFELFAFVSETGWIKKHQSKQNIYNCCQFIPINNYMK
jgi:hypothetical protein